MGSASSWWSHGYYGYGYGTSSYTSRYSSSLGWDSGKLFDTTTSYTSTYSSASYDSIDTFAKLLSRAHKAARDMVIILDFPYKVDLRYTRESYSDCNAENIKYIFVPTNILDDSDELKKDEQRVINTFSGQAIHEACHLKYTEYKVLTEFLSILERNYSRRASVIDGGSSVSKEEETDMLKEVKDGDFNLVSTLINLLEDERIENKLLSERPGFSAFIELAKINQYRQFSKNIREFMKVSDPSRYILNLFRMLRYPTEIESDIMEKYSESYNRIRSIIESGITSTKEACLCGLKIFKEVKRTFADFKFPKSAIEEVGVISIGILFNEVLFGYDHYEASDIRNRISSGKIAGTIRDSSVVEKIATGAAIVGASKTFYIKPTVTGASKTRYLNDYNEIRKYIPEIKKVVKGHDKNYDFTIQGCRSGLLDTTKLAEAYQGVPQVYLRQGHVRTNKTTVCVLIDESGSMGCGIRKPGGYTTREQLARQSAILLNEALGKLPGVDLYIYGHSADESSRGSTDIRIYREGSNTSMPSAALGEITDRYENRDGVAILETAHRVRKFTQSDCIMFVISDGEPCACEYHGYGAICDVRKKVTEAQKLGFSIIQISIDRIENADKMFDHVISLEGDVANLPKRLSQIIKKAIVKDKKTTVS